MEEYKYDLLIFSFSLIALFKSTFFLIVIQNLKFHNALFSYTFQFNIFFHLSFFANQKNKPAPNVICIGNINQYDIGRYFKKYTAKATTNPNLTHVTAPMMNNSNVCLYSNY